MTTVNNDNDRKEEKKKSIYTFQEARRMARSHGFESKKEYQNYTCPGAYRLPTHPDRMFATEWKGWDDWLAIPYPYEQAKQVAHKLQITSPQEWMNVFEQHKIWDDDDDGSDDHPVARLPYRPDLYYKNEWQGWEDWLGASTASATTIIISPKMMK